MELTWIVGTENCGCIWNFTKQKRNQGPTKYNDIITTNLLASFLEPENFPANGVNHKNKQHLLAAVNRVL